MGNFLRLGILNHAFGKKRYFLPLGTTPKTGVGFIAKKITECDDMNPWSLRCSKLALGKTNKVSVFLANTYSGCFFQSQGIVRDF